MDGLETWLAGAWCRPPGPSRADIGATSAPGCEIQLIGSMLRHKVLAKAMRLTELAA